MTADAPKPRKRRLRITFRDVFFFVAGTGVLVREFFLQQDPSVLGTFMVLMLYAGIPAFRADEGKMGFAEAASTLLRGIAGMMDKSVVGPPPPPPPDPPEAVEERE